MFLKKHPSRSDVLLLLRFLYFQKSLCWEPKSVPGQLGEEPGSGRCWESSSSPRPSWDWVRDLGFWRLRTCLGHVEQETASSLRFGSCRRAHGSRTFVTDLLSLGALWHTARDRHTGGVRVYPALPKQRAAGSACLLQALQKSHCLWNYSQLVLEHMV